MADLVHFLGLLGHKIHILRYIELKQAKNMKIDSTKRINLVSLKILIFGQFMGQKSLKITIIPYKGIHFLAITQPFFDYSG